MTSELNSNTETEREVTCCGHHVPHMVENEAKHHGHVADRSKWRLVGLCHIADTMIRAQKMRPDLAVVHAKAVETAQAIYDSEKAARTAAE